jgi:hypothetical protein
MDVQVKEDVYLVNVCVKKIILERIALNLDAIVTKEVNALLITNVYVI